MITGQLAAQLYSVREFLNTPADIAGNELVNLCRDTGLTICATHEPGDKIFSEPHTIVARLQKLGCQWFAVEQDICPGNPFDSLRQSFNYIRDYLCSR